MFLLLFSAAKFYKIFHFCKCVFYRSTLRKHHKTNKLHDAFGICKRKFFVLLLHRKQQQKATAARPQKAPAGAADRSGRGRTDERHATFATQKINSTP